MPLGPLESLSQPTDGTYGTAANFGTPVYHGFAGLIGSAAGTPDTNNGAPMHPRTLHSGMLPFTNAQGNTTNPGANPQSAYSASGALAYVVPNGVQLVVNHLGLPGATATAGYTTVATGAGTYNVASANPANGIAYVGMRLPLVLDQGWTITIQQGCSWGGYSVARDTQVTPIVTTVAAAIPGSPGTPAVTYTVPLGKTLWLLGAIAALSIASSTAVQLLAGSGVVCTSVTVAGLGGGIQTHAGMYGSALSGPVPLAAGTVLGCQSSVSLSQITFWGILI